MNLERGHLAVLFSSKQTGKLQNPEGLTLYITLLLAGALCPVQGWLSRQLQQLEVVKCKITNMLIQEFCLLLSGFMDNFMLDGKEDHIFFRWTWS